MSKKHAFTGSGFCYSGAYELILEFADIPFAVGRQMIQLQVAPYRYKVWVVGNYRHTKPRKYAHRNPTTNQVNNYEARLTVIYS